jgi:hypothetical protein
MVSETSLCPITGFIFDETTATTLGLSVTCTTPDLLSPCRTVIVPTSNERLTSGTPYPVFMFRFKAQTAEGAIGWSNQHTITINCGPGTINTAFTIITAY